METAEQRMIKLDGVKRRLQDVINSSDISIVETLGILEVLRVEVYAMALEELRPKQV